MAKTILLVGKVGTGKSATANTICGSELFKSDVSSMSVTKEFHKETFTYNDETICVIDSPGVFDCSCSESISTSTVSKLLEQETGIDVFLLTYSLADSFTNEDIEVQKVLDLTFGENWTKFGIVVFTHADLCKHELSDLLKKSPEIAKFVEQRFGGRRLYINNKDFAYRETILKFVTDFIYSNNTKYTRCDLPDESTCKDKDIYTVELEKIKIKLQSDLEAKRKKKTEELQQIKSNLEKGRKYNRCAFCKVALSDVHQSCQSGVICDECRINHYPDYSTVTSKPTDTQPENASCSVCQTNPKFKCKECKIRLCENCIEVHQRKVPSHKVKHLKQKHEFATHGVWQTKAKYKCKECRTKLCEDCCKAHQSQEPSHIVKPVKQKTLKENPVGICCFCGAQIILRRGCANCEYVCVLCEDFCNLAYPDHELDFGNKDKSNEQYNDVLGFSFCTNMDYCVSSSFCFDCKNSYCQRCTKRHKQECANEHLIVDKSIISLCQYESQNLEMIKCVIEISDDKTDFRLYFPHEYICGPGESTKFSTERPFLEITPMALFHKQKLVSIGKTAECHKAHFETLRFKHKTKWMFRNIWQKHTIEDPTVYYKRLFRSLKALWMMELMQKFHENKLNVNESAVELQILKTPFLTDILESNEGLEDDLSSPEIGLRFISDVPSSIIVQKIEKMKGFLCV